MENRVLFICTGNYYRSRFAEAVFNHHAEARGLPWRSFSRGLAIHLVPPGFHLSPHTQEHLAQRRIDLRHTASSRTQLSQNDLQTAQRVIALKDDEHRPMVQRIFPGWENRIVFWDIDDQPGLPPDEALAAIENQVLALIDDISAQSAQYAA